MGVIKQGSCKDVLMHVWTAGEPLPRRGGNRGGKGGEGEEPEGPEVVGSPWYITTAKTVMNLKSSSVVNLPKKSCCTTCANGAMNQR